MLKFLKNMKKLVLLGLAALAIIVTTFLLIKGPSNDLHEEEVLFTTHSVSKQYAVLRYRTDKILTEARKYPDHSSWNLAMDSLIDDWNSFSIEAEKLGKDAESMSSGKIGLEFVKTAYAYDEEEISQIFDRAPAGKKIATLAKHLGVDAKTAAQILQQDQARVTADAWKKAETFQKLENSAILIKDAAKVTVFVGTVVATGGAAGFAAGSVVAKASVIVSGADLIMEVTDDVARIGLGDENKISAIAGDARKVTEPLAGLLAVADLPKNMTKGIEKLSAVNFGAEQLNSVVQEGKIIGIKLPVGKKDQRFKNIRKYKTILRVSPLDRGEASAWIKDQVGDAGVDGGEENVKKILGIDNETEKGQGDDVATETGENDVVKPAASEGPGQELVQGEGTNEEEKPVTAQEDLTDLDTNVANRVEENVGANDLSLVPKAETIGSDWQGALRISLFKNAPIEIRGGSFSVSYSAPYSFGDFSGSGEIRLKGTYDAKTRTLQGSHYRKYDGIYKKEPRTIIYSGSFKHVLPEDDGETKINFSGSIQTTRLDGAGKPQTDISQGGTSQIYNVKFTGTVR